MTSSLQGELRQAIDPLERPSNVLDAEPNFTSRHSSRNGTIPEGGRTLGRSVLHVFGISFAHSVIALKVLQSGDEPQDRSIRAEIRDQEIWFSIEGRFELSQLASHPHCHLFYIRELHLVPRMHRFACALRLRYPLKEFSGRFHERLHCLMRRIDQFDRVASLGPFGCHTCSEHCDGRSQCRTQESGHTIRQRVWEYRQSGSSSAYQRTNEASKQELGVGRNSPDTRPSPFDSVQLSSSPSDHAIVPRATAKSKP